jgi:hypothetical protein
MKKVEAVRIRHGMTKREVCAEIGTDNDVLRSWIAGEAIGRKESVERIKAFLKNRN